VLVDCQAPLAGKPATYRLEYGGAAKPTSPEAEVAVQEAADTLTLNTGPLELVLSKKNMGLFQRVSLVGEGGRRTELFKDGAHADLWLEDQAGKAFRGTWAEPPEVAIEEPGPLRVAVKVEGWTQAQDGTKLGRHIVRLYAFAGKRWLRMYHTFVKTADSNDVQYRNISLHLPFKGSRYRFSGVEGHDGGNAAESDYLLQYRHSEYEVVSAGKQVAKGSRSLGTVAVSEGDAAYSVTVRHFWQNFPKEIEVTPGLLKLHFWPRHGKPAAHLGGNMTAKNIGFLWWVHEGESLDFRLPDEVYNFSYTNKPYDNIRASKQANAFGIAKTHEYLLDFHGSEEPAGPAGKEAARGSDLRAAVFRANPMMVVDPKWLADSGAFYNLAPRSEDYADVEEAIERTLMFLPAMMERIGDYGMWNFGSYHQAYLPTLDAAGIHRHWPGFHHGGPRWPWLVSVRSGQPEHYDYAEAHARHLMDTCTANWEDPAYNKEYWIKDKWWGHIFSLKYKGGICRYKGLVHWFAGMRMFYNCQADYALWYYYLTGCRRAWDVAMAHGEFLLRARDQIDDPKAKAVYGGRNGTARGSMAITLYEVTRDERYLKLAQEQMQYFMEVTDKEPERGYREMYYAPFIERYWAVTRDAKLKPYMLRWVRDRLAAPSIWNYRDQFYDLMALGYELTGDTAFLKHGLAQARIMLDNRAAGDDPILEGVIPSYFSGPVGYLGQQWGSFVRALNDHHAKTGQRLHLPELPDCLPMRADLWSLSGQTDGKGNRINKLKFHLRKQKGERIEIPFKFSTSDVTLVALEGHDGKAVDRKQIVQEERADLPAPAPGVERVVTTQKGKVLYHLRLGEDAAPGDYTLEFLCPNPRRYFSRYLPLPGKYSKLVIEMPFWLRGHKGALRFYFYPTKKPDGTPGKIRVQTRIRDKYFQVHNIYGPDAKLLVTKTERGHVTGPLDFTIDVPPQHQGKLWLYSLGGLGKSDGVILSGDVLPVMSTERDHFFVPKRFAH